MIEAVEYSSFIEVERNLLQLDSIQDNEKAANILLGITGLGYWLLKLRPNGNIYNRKELVLAIGFKPDCHILFKSMSAFSHTFLGGFNDELNKGQIEHSGSKEILNMFIMKVNRMSEYQSQRSTHTSPIREVRTQHVLNGGTGEEPIKKGWLLKKRDIISGWKCRYFELFVGRIVYYGDVNDLNPRGCILLTDGNAEIGQVHQMKIKRVSDHFGFLIELKKPDKTVRLASERTGIDGKAEAEAWYQALIFASNSDGKTIATNPLTINTPKSNSTRPNSLTSKLANLAIPSPLGGLKKGIKPNQSMFNLLLNQEAEDKEKTFQYMILSSLLILSLAIGIQYLYSYGGYISFQIYIALVLCLLVLIVIFLQEFIFINANEENEEVEGTGAAVGGGGKGSGSLQQQQQQQETNLSDSSDDEDVVNNRDRLQSVDD